MRVLGFLIAATCAFAAAPACGDDEKPPRLPQDGSGASSGGGRDGGSGGARAGGASDGGPGGHASDGTAPETGGVPTDAPIIVFPPIESGLLPEDAGAPERRDCSPTGTATVSAEPCLALAEAQCARYQTCTPFTLVVGYGDVATCVAVRRRECEATYGSPGQEPLLDAVHECAARWINAPCECVLGETCPALAPKPGNLPDGSPCYDARQCQGGVCTSTPFTCGECAAGTGLGEICGDERPACRAGLVCNAARVCSKPRVRGQRCATSDDCARDLACANRQCGDHVGAGEPCLHDAAVCDPLKGILCNFDTCVQVEYTETSGAGADAACGPRDGKLTLCSAKNLCSSPPFTAGQCEPRGGVGTACDPAETAERPVCSPELVCDPQSNQCAVPGPIACN